MRRPAARNPAALVDYLDDRADWAFGYGAEPRTHDCVRFMAGGVEAVTGVDVVKRFGATWTTERGARRILRRAGGLAAAVGSVMREISPTLAMRGDAGMTEAGQLVLVEGDLVVGPGPERGLVRLPRAALARAWTVEAEGEA